MKKTTFLYIIGYFIVCLLFLGLIIYDNRAVTLKTKDKFTFEKYLENPGKYGDIKIETFGQIYEIYDNYFYLDVGSNNLKIIGTARESILGEEVFHLHFKKDGTIVMLDSHNYHFNYVVYLISFFALIFFLILFFKEWKLTWKGFKDA